MMPGHSGRRDLRGVGHVGAVPGGRTLRNHLDLSSIIVRLPETPAGYGFLAEHTNTGAQ